MAESAREWIIHERKEGFSDEQIHQKLLEQGYDESFASRLLLTSKPSTVRFPSGVMGNVHPNRLLEYLYGLSVFPSLLWFLLFLIPLFLFVPAYLEMFFYASWLNYVDLTSFVPGNFWSGAIVLFVLMLGSIFLSTALVSRYRLFHSTPTTFRRSLLTQSLLFLPVFFLFSLMSLIDYFSLGEFSPDIFLSVYLWITVLVVILIHTALIYLVKSDFTRVQAAIGLVTIYVLFFLSSYLAGLLRIVKLINIK